MFVNLLIRKCYFKYLCFFFRWFSSKEDMFMNIYLNKLVIRDILFFNFVGLK